MYDTSLSKSFITLQNMSLGKFIQLKMSVFLNLILLQMLTLAGLPTTSTTSSASAPSASSLGVTPIRTGSLSSSLAQKHGATRKGDRQSRFSPSSTLDSSQRLIGEGMKGSEGEARASSMASVGRRLSLLAGETMNANKSCIDDGVCIFCGQRQDIWRLLAFIILTDAG